MAERPSGIIPDDLALSSESQSRIAQLREKLRESWNYTDVLALAIAKTESPKLASDLSKWNRVVFDLREQTREEHPQLLQDVFFDRTEREPDRVYSEQVERFLAAMRRAGALTRWSSLYEMKPDDKKDIIDNQSPPLKPFEPVIDEMAMIIDQRLGIKDE